MKKLILASSVLLPGLIFLSANAAQIKPFLAKYNLVLRGSSIGNYTRELNIKNDHYRYDSDSHTQFLFFKDEIKERSVGKVKNGFVTNEYAIGDAKGRQAPLGISFNHQTNMAEVRSGSKKQHIKIPAGINDNLSIYLNLQYALLNQKPLGQFAVIAQDKDHHPYIAKFSFERKNNVQIKTPLGDLNTVELSRFDKNNQLEDHFYFATKYQYLLVKTTAFKGDKMVVSSVISKYQS